MVYRFSTADKKVGLSKSTASMFRTHLNYIECVNDQLTGVTLTTNLDTSTALAQSKIAKFERLSVITAKSISAEVTACTQDADYSQVVAPWLPVKSYYRLYYLEAVLVYLLNGSENVFGHGGHLAVRKTITSLLKNGQLISNKQTLNELETLTLAKQHRVAAGANLRANYYQSADCIKSVRAKVAEYIEQNWKDSNDGVPNYRTKTRKDKRDNFLANHYVSLFDYFYWLRIKANYKDVDFLDFDNDINATDAYKYVQEYAEATEKYAKALKVLSAEVKSRRGM